MALRLAFHDLLKLRRNSAKSTDQLTMLSQREAHGDGRAFPVYSQVSLGSRNIFLVCEYCDIRIVTVGTTLISSSICEWPSVFKWGAPALSAQSLWGRDR
jgi:hypothetical protein